ncbi:MAG: HAD-IB family phosphatase, partial [Candidatus Poribacteria bacterium]
MAFAEQLRRHQKFHNLFNSVVVKTYPITTLITDFDGTITLEDTIANIAYAAADNFLVSDASYHEFLQSWHRVVKKFSDEYIQLFERLLDQPRPFRNNYDSLLKFLASFKEIELASVERVILGKFLAGIKREKLRNIGKDIKKQEGVETILAQMRKTGIKIDIISANWSRELIIGAMGDLCDYIVSNDLEFDKDGISTGQIDLHILSPFDKLKYYRHLKSETGKNLYIGDSVSDLLAILAADIGVLFGRGESVMRVISHFNIPSKELSEEDRFSGVRFDVNNTILIVDSWQQLNAFLTS